MMKPEILAPVGSFEALYAAVRCGADAVYFGGKAFNARRNASNFDTDEIKRAVEYCHSHGVKVHITLNTLVKDSELEEAYREIENMCRCGVDAFIVQDLGIAEAVKHICTDVALHASTQMSVQSEYGIELLKETGFSRVVLPREMSETEIKRISAATDIELECFVHGALCMCVSGQCLMSSVLGQRSGNRGLCAQPCRLPFGVNSPGGCNLSLKDLSLIDKIPALVNAGVCSLKIEGRMKRPEYVAAAVTACKNKLDGKSDREIFDALSAVFSRSGFTSGYFDSKLGKAMFGIRTKENVEASGAVLGSLSHLYDNENPLLPINIFFKLKSEQFPSLTVSCGEKSVTAVSDILPSAAINRELTQTEACERLSKCGGTQFYVIKADCEIDPGLNISASAINALRRDALSRLSDELAHREPYKINSFEYDIKQHRAEKRRLFLRFAEKSEIPADLSAADRVIIPLDTDDLTVKRLILQKIEVAAEIPVNVFSNGELYLNNLKRLKKIGVELAVADNIDGIVLARRAGMEFSTGFGMNVLNSLTLKVLSELGAKNSLVSVEAAADDISRIGAEIPRGALVYGRLPLMVTRNCPVKNRFSCSECGRESFLVDRMGIRFPVRCAYGCSYIFNSRPVYVIDRLDEIKNTDFDLLYFTVEKADEAQEIIKSYFERSAPDYEYTRGLYFKKLL